MHETNGGPALRRSLDDRVLTGVIGGLAKKWGLPSTRLRIAYVVLSIVSAAFPGIILYLLLWFLLPEE